MSVEELLEQARAVPSGDLPRFIGQLAEASAIAHSRLLAPAPAVKILHADELLSTREAARRLGISPSSLYHRDFPFTVRDPQTRRLRFSAREIEKWIAKLAEETQIMSKVKAVAVKLDRNGGR